MIRRFVVWSLSLLCVVALPSFAAGQPSVPVTLAWDPAEDNPEGYAVFIGTESGAYTQAVDVGTNTTYTFSTGVVGQRYYFNVAAYKPKPHLGAKANEVSTVVESPAMAGLEAPLVNGSNVMLRWHAQSMSPIVDFLLEAGSASGLSNIFSGSVGSITQLSASVGPGTYFVRVKPRTTTHVGNAYNEVSFSVGAGGCSAPPPAPEHVSGQMHGTAATISWTPSAGATTYGVQAGSESGLSNLFEGVVGPIPALSAPVPAGFRAYVRIYAINACGISPPSREVLVR
jgi:hypothetical protein